MNTRGAGGVSRCPTLGRAIYLSESSGSNADLVWGAPSRSRPGIFNLGILWPVELTCEVNHHDPLPSLYVQFLSLYLRCISSGVMYHGK